MDKKLSFAQIYVDLQTIEKILRDDNQDVKLLTSLTAAQTLILALEMVNIANNTNSK